MARCSNAGFALLGALVLLAIPAASTVAQARPAAGPAAMRPPKVAGVMLVSNHSVQREIKMTPAQIKKLADARTAAYKSIGLGGPNGQTIPPGTRMNPRDLGMIQSAQARVAAKILTSEQKKRLAEIDLQVEGPMALARPDIAAKLSLTQAQMTQLRRLLEDAMRRMMATARAAGAPTTAQDHQKLWAKVQQGQRDAMAKVIPVLTREQKAKWDAMLGKPFTFVAEPLFGPAAAEPQPRR